MRGDVVKGHLDLLLLAALAPAPAHGYAVIERLRERSEGAFDFPEGTIYPALHRLERSGLLRSGWDESSARRRRVYELTRRGRAALTEREEEWRRFRGAVDIVVAQP
jgi:PadR family transcriptional regulator, regulatory protein PadR